MLEKVINIIQICLMLVVGLAMGLGMMALPLWMLYKLIAPFFGPDPVGHMGSILKWALGFAAFLFTLWIVIMAGTWAYKKSVYVQLAFKVIGYTLAALFVVAAMSNCMGKIGSGGCVPSRYVDCYGLEKAPLGKFWASLGPS